MPASCATWRCLRSGFVHCSRWNGNAGAAVGCERRARPSLPNWENSPGWRRSGVAFRGGRRKPDTRAVAIADMTVVAALPVGWDFSAGHLLPGVVPGAVGAAAGGSPPVEPANMHLAGGRMTDGSTKQSFRAGRAVAQALAGADVGSIMRRGFWLARNIALRYWARARRLLQLPHQRTPTHGWMPFHSPRSANRIHLRFQS